ncbi:MAG TPA: hypothetical protein VMF35_11655 [Acidimicrobiales bacterium]|nr:hypothetical protein [Acidimicrobiales bacterium]
MHQFSTAGWEYFFGAIVGATAALTGLLFVAVSLNLDRILQGQSFLPRRAAESLGILIFVLYSAALVLVPQSSRLLGVEILVVVIPFMVATFRSQLIHLRTRSDDPLVWFVGRTVTTSICTIPGLFAGISLVAQWGGGIYWLVPCALLGIGGAVFGAWVLLVEIAR